MVRKGSSVRVRQRALRFWLLRAIYWFLELTFVTCLLRPYSVHGGARGVMARAGLRAVAGVGSLVDPSRFRPSDLRLLPNGGSPVAQAGPLVVADRTPEAVSSIQAACSGG